MATQSTPSVKFQIYAVRVGRWIQYRIYKNFEFTGGHYTKSQFKRTVKRGQLAGVTLFDIDGQSHTI